MSHQWIKIFNSEAEMQNNMIPGKAQSMVVKGNKICLVRSDEGLFAISDRCPHNGASLSSGYCNEKNEIICPLHRYPFDLKTGRATSGLAMSVKTYPVKMDESGVYIGIKAKWWES